MIDKSSAEILKRIKELHCQPCNTQNKQAYKDKSMRELIGKLEFSLTAVSSSEISKQKPVARIIKLFNPEAKNPEDLVWGHIGSPNLKVGQELYAEPQPNSSAMLAEHLQKLIAAIESEKPDENLTRSVSEAKAALGLYQVTL